MALNDNLLTIVRVLQIVLLLVIIYGAVEGVFFIKDTRAIMTEKLESGEIFRDLASAGDDVEQSAIVTEFFDDNQVQGK